MLQWSSVWFKTNLAFFSMGLRWKPQILVSLQISVHNIHLKCVKSSIAESNSNQLSQPTFVTVTSLTRGSILLIKREIQPIYNKQKQCNNISFFLISIIFLNCLYIYCIDIPWTKSILFRFSPHWNKMIKSRQWHQMNSKRV